MTQAERQRLAFLIRAYLPWHTVSEADKAFLTAAVHELASSTDGPAAKASILWVIDEAAVPIFMPEWSDLYQYLAAYRDGEQLLSRSAHANLSAQMGWLKGRVVHAQLTHMDNKRLAWVSVPGMLQPGTSIKSS